MTDETSTANSPAVEKPWQFQPGVVQNPSGRPKSFANYIRTLSLDGEVLVDKVFAILKHPKGKGLAAQKLQLDCIQWLADRGWGKAVQNVEHSGTIAHELSQAIDRFKDVSDEDLQTLIQAGRALNAAKAQAIEGESRIVEADVDASEC